MLLPGASHEHPPVQPTTNTLGGVGTSIILLREESLCSLPRTVLDSFSPPGAGCLLRPVIQRTPDSQHYQRRKLRYHTSPPTTYTAHPPPLSLGRVYSLPCATRRSLEN